MYFVCPCISRPYHRAWHIVAYSVNFCWMNESQRICNFSTNNTSLVTKQSLPVLFFVFYPNAFLVWSSQPACEVISYLYLTERFSHSFIHSTSTCYVSGPVLSAGDTELDKTWSLPSRNARFNGGDGPESSCFSAVGKCCERHVYRSRRA